MPLDKYYLNLAGEYRVAAELLKRGIFATITYGNKKGADIYAIGEESRKAAVIEVNSSPVKSGSSGRVAGACVDVDHRRDATRDAVGDLVPRLGAEPEAGHEDDRCHVLFPKA